MFLDEENYLSFIFLILNIFLSFSASTAANFFFKIMFEKKLDFFPLKWASEIGGDIYISTNFFRPTFDHGLF